MRHASCAIGVISGNYSPDHSRTPATFPVGVVAKVVENDTIASRILPATTGCRPQAGFTRCLLWLARFWLAQGSAVRSWSTSGPVDLGGWIGGGHQLGVSPAGFAAGQVELAEWPDPEFVVPNRGDSGA